MKNVEVVFKKVVSRAQFVLVFATTVKPRFNEVPRDWAGKCVRHIKGLLYQKPQFNKFLGKPPKHFLYQGIVNN